MGGKERREWREGKGEMLMVMIQHYVWHVVFQLCNVLAVPVM